MINVYNSSKLAFHREKLEALAKGEVTAPLYVRVKPTNKCDHSCEYCSYNPDNDCPVSELINFKDEIPFKKMIEILDDFRDIGVKAITYSGGGEPLIYPYIIPIMEKTLKNKIELSIITNGQKLNEERAKILSQAEWVRVSASESDPETFKRIRRRPKEWFYQREKNLEEFARIKKQGCEFGINFVVNERNFNQIYNSAKYFKELGVNHIKFTPAYSDNFLGYHKDIKKEAEEQILRARQDFQNNEFTIYDTYENDFNLTGLEQRKYPLCYIMQIVPIIGADSVVYFCHDKTYNKQGVLGDIKNRSFKNLWFSQEARKKFKNTDPRKICRHHCTYDSRNIITPTLIENINHLEKFQPDSNKHKNFI